MDGTGLLAVVARAVDSGGLWGLAAVAFVVGLSGAASPGPLLTVTIEQSMRRGFWAGPLLAVGHSVLEGLLVLALALGLAQVMGHPLVFGVIGMAGGLALMWMGWGLVYSGKVEMAGAGAGTTEGWSPAAAGRIGLLGVVVSLTNPYWIGWWATAGLAQMTASLALGAAGVVAFYLGHITSDLVWYSAVAGAMAKGRGVLRANTYRWLLAICGVFLWELGGYFIFHGIESLRAL